MKKEMSAVNQRSVRRNKGPTGPTIKVLSVLVLIALSLPSSLPFYSSWGVRAQTDPSVTGIGDWIIADTTIIKDQTLVIQGNIVVKSGGSLTLDNTILQFNTHIDYKYTFTVDNGGSLYIINGSYIGSLDKVFYITAAPGSKLRISDSTINGIGAMPIGSTDATIDRTTFTLVGTGYEGLIVLGGAVTVRNSTVIAGFDGLWDSNGILNVYDTKTTGNLNGIYVFPYCTLTMKPEHWDAWVPPWFLANPDAYCGIMRTAKIVHNHIDWSDNAGINIAFSTVTIENNTITGNPDFAGDGVHIMEQSSQVTMYNNQILGVAYGIFIDKTVKDLGSPHFPSIIQIENINITKSTMYSFFIKDTVIVDVSLRFKDRASFIDSPFQLKAPITISDGGQLDLVNTSLDLFGTVVRPYGITVDNGGLLKIEGITTVKNPVGLGSYFKVLNGGSAHISHSNLSGWGYDWGTTGENAGIYSASDLTIDNSTISDGYDGIILDGGTSVVYFSILNNCTDGLRVLSGELDLYNSTISSMRGLDIKIDDGQVELFDTPFNTKRYLVSSGKLDMFWSCDLKAMWNNGVAINNATFNISEPSGEPVINVVSGTTGPEGLSEVFYLREFTDTGTGLTKTTPHKASGAYLGMKNTTMVDIIQTTTIPLYIPDNGLPWLKVIFPGLQVFQKNNTLFVNGSAGDNESGLDRVQWSLDQDLWTDVEGLATWNLSMKLSFGSYNLYLRALDRAGNVYNKTMIITIDSSPPSIHILEPTNGYITKLRTVLVYGMTEIGSTVTILNQSITSTDGSFRLSVPIEEGSNLIVANVKDPTGNTNSTTVLVIRDTTPPKILITNPPEDYITNKISEQNLPVTGLTEPGAKLISEGRLISVNDDGTFAFTFGLKEGINEISLIVEDTLGNQNSTIRHVIYDRTIPSLNISSPKDGLYTNKQNITITGNTEPSANVTARSINFTATVKADQEGRFSVTVGLSEGPNLLQVTAKDRAGNIRTASVNIFKDTLAPALILSGVTEGMVTDQSYLIVEGQTDIGARVKFNGNIITVGVSGNFGVTLNLFQANNTFVFESMDKAGNSKVVTLHIKRKVTPEPKPTGADAALDYLPWLVIAVLIGVIIQWAFLAKVNRDKAKSKHLERISPSKGTEDEEGSAQKAYPRPSRIEPRRSRQQSDVVVETGAPEFEIEYGDGSNQGPGGGRR
jgi:hypothetical protein